MSSQERYGAVIVGGGHNGLVAAFYLLREHWGPALGALPHRILLACPVMHLFMHHGHRHRGSGPSGGSDRGTGAA